MIYSIGGRGGRSSGATAQMLLGMMSKPAVPGSPAPAGTVTDASNSYAPGSAGAMLATANGTGQPGGNAPGTGGAQSNYYRVGAQAAGGGATPGQPASYTIGKGGGGSSY